MFSHLLHRIDPEVNMSRYYRVDLSCDLFDAVIVERTWGRKGSFGQCIITSYPSMASAEDAAAKLILAKQRRGYSAA